MNKKIALAMVLVLVFSTSALWAVAPQEPSARQEPAGETPQEFEMVVPEGTVIPIVLTAYLNTKSSQIGDTVYADTTYPIWIQQRLIIPKGSTIRGTVTDVIRPGKIKGKGRLAVRFDDILLPNGVKRELIATFRGIHGSGDETLDRKSEKVSGGTTKGDDVGTVVGTTSEGTIIGALIGRNGTGAGIGAGVGAAAGLATVLFTRGRDLVLSPGTQFDLELKKSMRFAYNELQFTNMQLDGAERDIRTRTAAPNAQGKSNGNRPILPFPGIGFPRTY
jgi:type IV secretion system protein VirB10